MAQKKVTAVWLLEMKQRGEKITMLTAYDYCTALLMDQSLAGNRAEVRQGHPGQMTHGPGVEPLPENRCRLQQRLVPKAQLVDTRQHQALDRARYCACLDLPGIPQQLLQEQ